MTPIGEHLPDSAIEELRVQFGLRLVLSGRFDHQFFEAVGPFPKPPTACTRCEVNPAESGADWCSECIYKSREGRE